jgi:hypothetical protein
MPYAFTAPFMVVEIVVVESDETEEVILSVWAPAGKKLSVQASVLYHGHGYGVWVWQA